jgi:DNA repair protein RecO (recombination protein O)
LLYNTEAIVVRSIAYGESDAIVTLLTPGGLVAVMARGAKKPQSRLAAGVQLCVQGTFTLYRRSGMGTLSQVEMVNSRRGLREDLQRAAYAAYFCELVAAISEEAPNGSEVVYRLFAGALDRLEMQESPPPVTARIWETKILRLVGASPDWTTCVHCHREGLENAAYSPREGGFVCELCTSKYAGNRDPGQSMWVTPSSVPKILKSFEIVPWNRLGSVRLSQATLEAIKRILEVQLRDFAGLWPRSRSFLDSIDEVYPDTQE